MKKIIALLSVAGIARTSFCQKTNDSVPVVKTDYLAKSKNQKTAAWILLGTAFTTLTIAVRLAIARNLLLMILGTVCYCWHWCTVNNSQHSSFYCIPEKTKEEQ